MWVGEVGCRSEGREAKASGRKERNRVWGRVGVEVGAGRPTRAAASCPGEPFKYTEPAD